MKNNLAKWKDGLADTRNVIATQREDIDLLSERIQRLENAPHKPGTDDDELQQCRAELERLQQENAAQIIQEYSTKAGELKTTIKALNDNLKRTMDDIENKILEPLRQHKKPKN